RLVWATCLPRRSPVEAASALAPAHPRFDQAPERLWSLEPVAVRLRERVSDVHDGVEPDVIREFQWPHRMVEAELDGSVDVVARRHTLLEQSYSLEEHCCHDPCRHEPLSVLDGDDRLAAPFG